MAEMVTTDIQQAANVIVGEAVVHHPTGAPRADQVARLQPAQGV